MNKVVSIVIPVYNVEKYIRECLESVINQTYKNLQIILVDDGSTDASGKICDEYATKDSRITVVHQNNQGAGAAKNTGLELVKGEYLSLIDSDDYIELNMYELLVSTLEKLNVDVVQCMINNVFVNGIYPRRYNFEATKARRVLSARRFLFEMLYDWKYCIFFNKLFRTSLLQNARFPIGRKIDDEFFTYKLICNAERVVNINNCLCNYRMRKSSVMNQNSEITLITDRIDCFLERRKYIPAFYPELKEDLDYLFSDFLLYSYNTTGNEKLKAILKPYINDNPLVQDSIISRLKRKIKTRNLIVDKDEFGDKGILFD